MWTGCGAAERAPADATDKAGHIVNVGHFLVPLTLAGVAESAARSGSAPAPIARSNDLASVTTGLNTAALPPSANAAGGSGQWVYLDRYSVNTAIDDAFNPAKVEAGVAAAMQYVWKAGDTLRGLAQAYYGDANLWYVIAGANGVAEDNDVAAGSTLSIPSVTRSSNTANTLQVYNASQITGNTDPTAIPPPPPKDRCVLASQIIGVIVAAVVTAYSFSPVAGAAAGDAARQYSLAAFNHRLDWRDLVTRGNTEPMVLGTMFALDPTGISASRRAWKQREHPPGFTGDNRYDYKSTAMAAGAGAVASGVGAATTGWESVAARSALTAAVTNIAAQGMAIVLGRQESFDWRSVAVSAIAAPVATEIAGSGGDGFAGSLSVGIARGVVSQTVRMLVYRGGKQEFASIVADAFGNALGGSIVA